MKTVSCIIITMARKIVITCEPYTKPVHLHSQLIFDLYSATLLHNCAASAAIHLCRNHASANHPHIAGAYAYASKVRACGTVIFLSLSFSLSHFTPCVVRTLQCARHTRAHTVSMRAFRCAVALFMHVT